MLTLVLLAAAAHAQSDGAGGLIQGVPLARHGVMAWNVGPPTAFW
eukprot:COSAG03_NODE_4707_length_1459_cov_35.363286_4_plen_44_part_01